MSQNPFSVSTSKDELQNIFSLQLTKAGFKSDLISKVAIAMDDSGSMMHYYSDGTVKALVQRGLTLANEFDDDGNIDMFNFTTSAKFLGQVEQKNFDTYTPPHHGGGTAFKPVMQMLEDYFYKSVSSTSFKKEEVEKPRFGGIFGNFFGTKKTTKKVKVTGATSKPKGRDDLDDKHPVYLIFITDGASFHPSDDNAFIDAMLKRHPDMFICTFGIGGGAKNQDLAKLAKAHSNMSFNQIEDLSKISEQELAAMLLCEDAKRVLESNQMVK